MFPKIQKTYFLLVAAVEWVIKLNLSENFVCVYAFKLLLIKLTANRHFVVTFYDDIGLHCVFSLVLRRLFYSAERSLMPKMCVFSAVFFYASRRSASM